MEILFFKSKQDMVQTNNTTKRIKHLFFLKKINANKPTSTNIFEILNIFQKGQ